MNSMSNTLDSFLLGQVLPGLMIALAANWSVSWVDRSRRQRLKLDRPRLGKYYQALWLAPLGFGILLTLPLVSAAGGTWLTILVAFYLLVWFFCVVSTLGLDGPGQASLLLNLGAIAAVAAAPAIISAAVLVGGAT